MVNSPEVAPTLPGIIEAQRKLAVGEYVVKFYQRCQFACDYCYMYELADQSWRAQPLIMSDRIIGATADRIAEHATEHNLPQVTIFGHGGEPMLAERVKPGYFRQVVTRFNEAMPAETRINWRMQSNGALLNKETLDELQDLQFVVSVSVDGDQASHDKHRIYPSGKGTFKDVATGVNALRAYPNVYGGILTTIDVHNDPIATYHALRSFDPPIMDFQLPLGNWTTLPDFYDLSKPNPTELYADWLIEVFDEWRRDPDADKHRIRTYEVIKNLIYGQPTLSESFGLTPPRNLTIDTDGSINDIDSLKATANGMPNLGLNVLTDSIDSALQHPKVRNRMLGRAALGDDCLNCELLDVCGGGLYADRYRENGGIDEFRNRSVYCDALMKLITYVADSIREDIVVAQQNSRPTSRAY